MNEEQKRRAQLIDTDALRKLCKSATPGPWEQINHIVFTETGDLEWVVANARSGNSIIDAEYIAAANPATVLALLDEIDRSRGTIDIVSAALFAAEKELADLRPIKAAAMTSPKSKAGTTARLRTTGLWRR